VSFTCVGAAKGGDRCRLALGAAPFRTAADLHTLVRVALTVPLSGTRRPAPLLFAPPLLLPLGLN